MSPCRGGVFRDSMGAYTHARSSRLGKARQRAWNTPVEERGEGVFVTDEKRPATTLSAPKVAREQGV